jgi:TatD DNase family protein
MGWIDTHCHLDAPEFAPDRAEVVARARQAGVKMMVLPAVRAADFDAVRALAHAHGLSYALGIHPLCVDEAQEGDLQTLRQALAQHAQDPRLVAVGEIGLDFFVPGLSRERQQQFYQAQLKLAREAGLPVLLHVRRSADALLAGLRRCPVGGGLAHAFNGSEQQARAFIGQGFKLGFGGTLTFDRALQIRRLAQGLGDEDLVLETDAPDIPPHWLYRTQAQRQAGSAGGQPTQARNEPCELPRIAQVLSQLRGCSPADLARHTRVAACQALPKLAPLMEMSMKASQA